MQTFEISYRAKENGKRKQLILDIPVSSPVLTSFPFKRIIPLETEIPMLSKPIVKNLARAIEQKNLKELSAKELVSLFDVIIVLGFEKLYPDEIDFLRGEFSPFTVQFMNLLSSSFESFDEYYKFLIKQKEEIRKTVIFYTLNRVLMKKDYEKVFSENFKNLFLLTFGEEWLGDRPGLFYPLHGIYEMYPKEDSKTNIEDWLERRIYVGDLCCTPLNDFMNEHYWLAAKKLKDPEAMRKFLESEYHEDLRVDLFNDDLIDFLVQTSMPIFGIFKRVSHRHKRVEFLVKHNYFTSSQDLFDSLGDGEKEYEFSSLPVQVLIPYLRLFWQDGYKNEHQLKILSKNIKRILESDKIDNSLISKNLITQLVLNRPPDILYLFKADVIGKNYKDFEFYPLIPLILKEETLSDIFFVELFEIAPYVRDEVSIPNFLRLFPRSITEIPSIIQNLLIYSNINTNKKDDRGATISVTGLNGNFRVFSLEYLEILRKMGFNYMYAKNSDGDYLWKFQIKNNNATYTQKLVDKGILTDNGQVLDFLYKNIMLLGDTVKLLRNYLRIYGFKSQIPARNMKEEDDKSNFSEENFRKIFGNMNFQKSSPNLILLRSYFAGETDLQHYNVDLPRVAETLEYLFSKEDLSQLTKAELISKVRKETRKYRNDEESLKRISDILNVLNYKNKSFERSPPRK